MNVPAYILERFKDEYLEGKIDWSFISLTSPYRADLPNKIEQRAMFIMLGADEPDINKRMYWDYNDGQSYSGNMSDVIKHNPGELDAALKLCLREFVATEDKALLVQRLNFIGNILVRHHEVFDEVVDAEFADLFLGHLAPLTAIALTDLQTEITKDCHKAMAYAYSLESKVHQKTPDAAKGLTEKFTAFSKGLLPLLNEKGITGYPPAPATFAKLYLEGHHPRHW